jgi:hypothetical protein
VLRRLGNRKQPKVLRQRLQRHGRNTPFQVRSIRFSQYAHPSHNQSQQQ